MIRYLFVAGLLLWLLPRAAAQPAYRPYFSADTTQAYQLATAQRTAIRAYFGTAKTGSSEYRAHYQRVVEQASAEVYNAIRHSALLDPVLNAAVQRVFRQVQQANPQLPPARLVLTRNPEANAHAVGNGTILLNVGLLPTLENESQLAFILCHELAHVQCRHQQTTIQEQLGTIHSREMRREVRRIVQAEYNISSRMKSLVMGLSLNGTYHQRRHERQADSLGYVLLRRTSFDASQAHRALQLLDQMDAPASAAPLELGRYFGCAAFGRPLETEAPKSQSIFAVQAPVKTVLETTDTLKSHPDCAKRMGYLRTLAGGAVAEGPQPVAPEFARLRAVSRLEVVQSWFDTECYDHALFEALLLLPTDPQNAYLRAIVQLSLHQLHYYQLTHRLTEVVSNVSGQQPANFNQLLHTLYGLRTTEYQGLSACFAQLLPPPAADTDEYALAARYAAAALAEDATRAQALQQQYLAQYQNGRFAARLFPPPPAPPKRRR